MEGKNEWVVRVNEEAQKVRLTDTCDTIRRLKKCSIYKLPDAVVNLNKKAYLPQWVSLGPYHHGRAHLLPMEENKHRALLYTLKRSNQNLESYVQAVEEVVDDLLDSYLSIDPYWRDNRDAFVKLMILDGCFMLEIVKTSVTSCENYPPGDPVFGEHGILHVLPYIRLDMIMLENQLPLLLLEKLAAVEKVFLSLSVTHTHTHPPIL